MILIFKIDKIFNQKTSYNYSGGATLRQASELFKIPKTVLWRRVKKEDSVKVEGDLVQRRIFKRSYDASSKAEAIKALERGENFTKVAQQFNVILFFFFF